MSEEDPNGPAPSLSGGRPDPRNGAFEEWNILGFSFREKAGRLLVLLTVLIVLVIGTVCLVDAVRLVGKPFPGFLVNERILPVNLGRPQWTGPQAGMRYPDKILRANDVPLSSVNDLHAVVNATRVGDPVLYTVERNGNVFQVSVPTMRFTWTDLFFTFGPTFVAGILYLIMGLVVYVLKPDTKVTWVFFLCCLLIGLYQITNFDVSSGHRFVRLYLLLYVFIPAATLHLSLLFPVRQGIVDRFPNLPVFPYVLSILLVIPLEWLYPHPAHTTVFAVARGYVALSILVFLGSVIRAYWRDASVLARQRAKVVLSGAAVAFPVPAIVNNLSFLGSTPATIQMLNTFLGIPLLVFPWSISYAIARHNLFDVDVFIKRAVGYALMTLLIGSGYFFIQTVVKTVVLDPLFGEAAEQLYPVLFAFLTVFFFNPLNRTVQDLVDQLFFRKKFDYKDTITSVSHTLTSLLDQRAIVQTLLSTVRGQMYVDTAGVLLVTQQGSISMFFQGDEVDGNGKPRGTAWDASGFPEDPLVALLSRKKKVVTKYDVAEDPDFADVRDSCGKRFASLEASLAIPLIHRDEVKGVLAVGQKKSGHFFTREDIDLLETLGNQGAVALENARLAVQMKQEEGVRANLARYLSPQIVDQIIHDNVQVNLGGDRKVVTVLFSDIRNFTTLTETRPPDQLVHILNEYFTEMARIIFSHQGSLDKYIGDAIVAVFGSLIHLENPALHATRAAIQMMEAMPRLNEIWMKEFGFRMDIGIGVNTGEVFLGNIGSPDRMEFTVIGDTVNVASRFSGLAKAGQILLTRETLAALGSTIPYHELPPSEVKGKTGKLEVFEVALA